MQHRPSIKSIAAAPSLAAAPSRALASTRTERLAIVDVFRFLCICAVMAFHYTVRWQPPISPTDIALHHKTFSMLFGLGQYGVHVFFVISGFVIALTLSKCSTIGDFAWRRFARLYPAFLVATTLSFLLMSFVGPPQFQVNLFDYLANISLATALGAPFELVEGAYWSLGVELKFYACAALMWGLLGRYLWVGLLVIAIAGEFTTNGAIRDLSVPQYMPLFLVGIGLWLWLLKGERVNGLALIAVSVALFVYADPTIGRAGHVFIWGLVSAMAMGICFAPELSVGPLATLGEMSYAVYLIHEHSGVSLMNWLASHFDVPDIPKIVVAAVAMYALGALIFLIEVPARRFLVRHPMLGPRPATPAK